MTIVILLLSLLFLSAEKAHSESFKEQQLQYPRVRKAIAEKGLIIYEMFEQHDVQYPPRDIYLRVFKEEMVLEFWARSCTEDTFVHIKNYDICSLSGALGPKRKQGDRQVPEGFYFIDRFNPASAFHLSLGINYPNRSDRLLGRAENSGGDIFIHGSCVTIGCIPITDDKIKELYIITVEATENGQERIPVHIFPRRLDDEGFADLVSQFQDRQTLISFWTNLQQGFRIFESAHLLPDISVDMNGNYIFKLNTSTRQLSFLIARPFRHF